MARFDRPSAIVRVPPARGAVSSGRGSRTLRRLMSSATTSWCHSCGATAYKLHLVLGLDKSGERPHTRLVGRAGGRGGHARASPAHDDQRGMAVIGPPKTHRSARRVAIPEFCVEVLIEHASDRQPSNASSVRPGRITTSYGPRGSALPYRPQPASPPPPDVWTGWHPSHLVPQAAPLGSHHHARAGSR